MLRDWDKTYRAKGITQTGVLPTVELTRQIFKQKSCSNVLDLGCGTGRHALYLAQDDLNVYGVDKSPHAIKILMEKVKKENVRNVFLSVADMHTLPYKTRVFDGVMCVWSTGHGYRKDVVKSLDEMCGVMKADGVLLADFPSVKDKNFGEGIQLDVNTFLHPFLDHPDVPHNYLSKDELDALLKERFEDFHVREITYEDPKYNAQIEAFWVEAHRPLRNSKTRGIAQLCNEKI